MQWIVKQPSNDRNIKVNCDYQWLIPFVENIKMQVAHTITTQVDLSEMTLAEDLLPYEAGVIVLQWFSNDNCFTPNIIMKAKLRFEYPNARNDSLSRVVKI